MVVQDIVEEEYNDGSKHFFTKSGWFMNAYKSDGLDGFFTDTKIRFISRFKLLETGYKEVIDRYINWIVNELKYSPQQVIVIVNKKNYVWYKGKDYRLFEYDSRKKMNDWLEKIYGYFSNSLPGCHMIYEPFMSMSDPGHKWGLLDLHSDKSYYDYFLYAIDAIVEKREKDVFYLRESFSNANYERMLQMLMEEHKFDLSFPEIKGKVFNGHNTKVGEWTIINWSALVSGSKNDLIISRANNSAKSPVICILGR